MSNELLDDDIKPTRKKQTQREIELDVVRNVMSTVQGRAMMWRFVAQAGIFSSTFNPDSHVHAYQAGRREQGLLIDSDLRDASDEFYYLMLRENNAR